MDSISIRRLMRQRPRPFEHEARSEAERAQLERWRIANIEDAMNASTGYIRERLAGSGLPPATARSISAEIERVVLSQWSLSVLTLMAAYDDGISDASVTAFVRRRFDIEWPEAAR